MGRFFSHIGITAMHEFRDAIRSRWAISLLLVYVAICTMAAYKCTDLLVTVEQEMIATLQVVEGAGDGVFTSRLWETKLYRRILTNIFDGDQLLVDYLMNVHPMALFFAGFTIILGPLLTLLMSSPRVAEELGTRSARFVLFRSTQLAWTLGKYWGQAMVLLPAMLACALSVWLLSSLRLEGFKPLTSIRYLLEFGVTSYLYVLAWLGVALGVSQLTRSQFLAVVLAIAVVLLFGVIEGLREAFGGIGVRQLFDIPYTFTPMAYRLHLWGPGIGRQLLGGFMLIALGHLFVCLGYVWTRRRDL